MNTDAFIPDSAFRAYDVRGVAGKDFDEPRVRRLGRAIGTYFRNQGLTRAVTAHDCRLTSPEYHGALCAGLQASGVHAVSVGMVPTPVFYFAVTCQRTQAGVMVTASHNPPEYNGFKIWAGPTTIHGPQIQEVRRIFESGEFAEGSDLLSKQDIVPAYTAAVFRRTQKAERRLKVVVDGGNGVGGMLCASLLEQLGYTVIRQLCDPDGRFPYHHPDPSVAKNMLLLQERVRAEKADIGIGLDGDGDRLGVVDEKGRLLYGDELAALLARNTLRSWPGSLILADVKCSTRLLDDIRAHGGRAAFCPTGHSIVKALMREQDAAMAGDVSGHMYFNAGWFGFDDALFAAATVCGLLSASDEPLSAVPGWEVYACTPEIQVACPDEAKQEVMERVTEQVRHAAVMPDGLTDLLEIDGVRLNFADGWLLIRASNTQPMLTLRFEAKTWERLTEFKALARRILEASLPAPYNQSIAL